MKDNYGRTINYLRVSVTDRCNLRCIYCMPEQGVIRKDHNDILRFEEIVKIINSAAGLGINKVRFTGGEPLIIQDIDKLINETHRIQEIKDISITTNGILLDGMAMDLKAAGLSRVNISLDTLDRDKYKRITRLGEIDKVLSAIDKCISLNMKPVKINTVLMRGINDNEVTDFIRLAKELPLEIRFIELMPIGEGIKMYEKGKIDMDEILKEHPELIPLENQKSSTAQLYVIKNGKGSVGFINPMSCKFCSECNKIRLTAAGTIKPCLHSKEEIDVKKYANNELMLKKALMSGISGKPFEHHLDDKKNSESLKFMYQIGG